MSRLIDADELIDRIPTPHDADERISRNGAIADMVILACNAPTVDAVPVVHGHWIMKKDFIGTKYECSECGHSDSKTTAIRGHYCWYCGARMDGGTEDEQTD